MVQLHGRVLMSPDTPGDDDSTDRTKPPLPDDPRESLPAPDRACPECGADHSRAQRPSSREPVAPETDRIDYWCVECGAHVGTVVDYTGPVPVQVGPNTTELH